MWVLRSLAVAGMMLVGLAAPAGAAVLNQPVGTISIGSIAPPGFSPIGGTVAAGAFTEFFNFTIASAFDFTASATADATPGTNGAAGTPSVNNFTLAILNGSGPNPGSQIAIDQTPTNDNGALHLALMTTLLQAGNYTVRLAGEALGNGANLGGAIALTNPSPIPLPGALVLFGSGLVGLCALTRKRPRRNAHPVMA
jgi:opacity protein-like surface antigen